MDMERDRLGQLALAFLRATALEQYSEAISEQESDDIVERIVQFPSSPDAETTKEELLELFYFVMPEINKKVFRISIDKFIKKE